MPSFWPRLAVHVLTWLALVLQLPMSVIPWALFLAAFYLSGFFVSQLKLQSATQSRYRTGAALLAVIAAVTALAVANQHISAAFLILVAWLLVAPPLVDLVIRTEEQGYGSGAMTIAAVALAAAAFVAWLLRFHDAAMLDYLALVLAAAVTISATASFRRVEGERRGSRERYSALLSEYRNLKRAAASSADAARSEERMSVARRLHDSVGHRLTSLLMQIETERLGAEERGAAGAEELRRAEELKRLAQLGLDETRAAVTALSDDELMGMPALLRLINNLEVESAMQVEFTLGSGALTVQLDKDQSVALYRAVQEALTNAMRHGVARRARVKVEVPAGRLVRFEVENDLRPGPSPHQPGFGLTTMRERVEAAGGELEILAGAKSFLVRGSFPVSA